MVNDEYIFIHSRFLVIWMSGNGCQNTNCIATLNVKMNKCTDIEHYRYFPYLLTYFNNNKFKDDSRRQKVRN